MLKDGFLPQGSHLSFLQEKFIGRGYFNIMNKNSIKVIKRKNEDGTEKTKVDVNAVKIKRDIKFNLVNAVNNWISERRKNSRIEKVYSNSKILEWKILPKNSKEPIG